MSARTAAICRRVGWDALLLAGLAALSITIGVGLNLVRPSPVPWRYISPAQHLLASVRALEIAEHAVISLLAVARLVSLEDMETHVSTGDALILDVRPEIFHQLEHIPGARPFPKEEFARRFLELRAELEADPDRKIILYCDSASCYDSKTVADALLLLDVQSVHYFKPGLEGWKEAGLATESLR